MWHCTKYPAGKWFRTLDSHSDLFIFVKSNKLHIIAFEHFILNPNYIYSLPRKMSLSVLAIKRKYLVYGAFATISQLHGWIIYVSARLQLVCLCSIFIYAHKPIHLSALAFCCAWKTTIPKNISPGTEAIYCTLFVMEVPLVHKNILIKGKRIAFARVLSNIVKWRRQQFTFCYVIGVNGII